MERWYGGWNIEIKHLDVVLCNFYFSDFKKSKDRPVLVFKDNLPHDDFIAIPISSQIDKMHEDEVLIQDKDFSEGSIPKILTDKHYSNIWRINSFYLLYVVMYNKT